MEPAEAARQGKGAVRETLETILIALALALLIRTFLVQLYRVDGESMLPTLHHGDRLVVNKILYRLRPPRAGEVLVLNEPGGSRRQLIKRVVATAGETVEFRDQVVYVDGAPLTEPFIKPMTYSTPDLPPLTIPEGHIYVLGDNRGGSLDSRVFGPISVKKVQGKAVFLFWPLDRARAHGPLTAERSHP